MKIVLIAVAIFLLSGCTTKKPSVTEYKIVSKNSVGKSNFNGCKSKSLKVAQAFSSSALMSFKMDYSLPNNKVFSYSQSQWSESPNHLITKEVLKKVRSSDLFKSVQVSKSRSKSDWILETNIEDYMQYYTEDLKKSHAAIVISLTLLESKTADVIATKTFISKVESDTPDANGGVKALNTALDDVLYKNIGWLNGVCR